MSLANKLPLVMKMEHFDFYLPSSLAVVVDFY